MAASGTWCANRLCAVDYGEVAMAGIMASVKVKYDSLRAARGYALYRYRE